MSNKNLSTTHRVQKYKQVLSYEMLHMMELANNLYNQAMYLNRQYFFKKNKVFNYNKLDKHFKNLRNYFPEYNNYGNMLVQSAQQILKICSADWKGFLKSIQSYNKYPNKFSGKPKLPRYKKSGSRMMIKLTNQQCKVINDVLYFPKRLYMSPIKLYKTISKLIEVRVFPNGSIELVHEVIKQPLKQNGNIASIDLGLDNLATVVINDSNIRPLIINGKGLKSYNKYWNELRSKIQSSLKIINNKHYSKTLNRIDIKRNNFMLDKLHKASYKIIQFCIKNNVNKIVVGHNKNQKQHTRLKNFVQVPIFSLIKYIKYKADFVGIEVIETEESYTSGTSFLDNELPTKKNYNKERRIYRGCFKSNSGKIINSDVNGAFQIMKKVVRDVVIPSNKGFLFNPLKLNI